MSGQNEIGISPALLQAITHTISRGPQTKVVGVRNGDGPSHNGTPAPGDRIMITPKDYIPRPLIKLEGGDTVLQGLPVALQGQQTFRSGDTIFVVQNSLEGSGEVSTEEVVSEHTKVEDHDSYVVTESQLSPEVEDEKRVVVEQSQGGVMEAESDTMVVVHNGNIDPGGVGVSSIETGQGVETELNVSSHGNHGNDDVVNIVPQNPGLNISNVLSVIDSRIKDQYSVIGPKVLPQSSYTIDASALDNGGAQDLSGVAGVATSYVLTSGPDNKPVYVSISGPSPTVPSPTDPTGDITVSEVEQVIQTTPAYMEGEAEEPAPKRLRIVEVPVTDNSGHNGTAIIVNNGELPQDGILKAVATADGTIVYKTVSALTPDMVNTAPGGTISNSVPMGMCCPICSDRVSGYHYGIYSCESCKGFFKRTVQNKKAFICHRLGDCVITVANRKKCPACRFKRCLTFGMRLEAIREDRMRGGRSSYDGCSPHGRTKPAGLHTPKEPRRIAAMPKSVVIQTPTGPITIPTSRMSSPNLASPGGYSSPGGSSPGVITLPRGSPGDEEGSVDGASVASQIQPTTPQLLEDLIAVESLMMDDEDEQACCEGRLTDTDLNPFGSLLHIADHCLYKIVRWARNLPDFASVTTDDQILLLQNCWAELLCLCVCWHSMRSDGTLRLAHNRQLTPDQAHAMGIGEVIQRLLDFTAFLKELEVDQYEYVALKVLLLLSPDVRNLKDEGAVRAYQDRVTECLLMYTSTNYPTKYNKFVELVARITELTRTCAVGKDQLIQRQASGEIPQYSLLSELLKGDIAVQ